MISARIWVAISVPQGCSSCRMMVDLELFALGFSPDTLRGPLGCLEFITCRNYQQAGSLWSRLSSHSTIEFRAPDEVRLSSAGADWANGQLDAEIDTRVCSFHSLFAP